jgi:signal transduction histidine kinase
VAISKRDNANHLPLAAVSGILRQKELPGICQLLENIANRLKSSGCVLWEFVNETTPDTPTTPAIYALSQWFAGSAHCSCRSLPLTSELGQLVSLGTGSLRTNDALQPADRADYHPLARELGLRSVVSVPLQLSDDARGALSIYRKGTDAYSDGDEIALKEAAEIVPLVLETLRDQLGYRLLAVISDIVAQAEAKLATHNPGSHASFDQLFQTALLTAVSSISHLLESLEVSLFLKMPHHGHEQFECVASNVGQHILTQSYVGKSEEGLTGWVLEHQKPLRILDLKALRFDGSQEVSSYSPIIWRDSAQIEKIARKHFNTLEGQASPPLSFMAVPITAAETTIGVLRCAALRAGLNHYGSRELALLSQVAVIVARYWAYYRNRLESVHEVLTLNALARGLNRLNDAAQKELDNDEPSQMALFAGALELLHTAIPEATGFDIRLVDPMTNQLKYVARHGTLWDAQPEDVVVERAHATFDLADNQSSAGAWALSAGRPFVSASPLEASTAGETFPNVKGLIVAPIGSPAAKVGVVDVHVTEAVGLSERVGLTVQLVAQQLGLYYHLAAATAKRRRLELDRAEDARRSIQMLQDISHQLRSPINQAHLRIQSALRLERLDEGHKTELLKIRGLCGKAKRVTTSFRLFAALAKDESLSLEVKPIRYDELIRSVIEAASDHELLLGISKNVRFEVERKGFEMIERRPLKGDLGLLMQSIDCLVDNAAKYSMPRTICKISAGVSGRDRFYISVQNRGLVLSRKEARRCSERGWRSEQAWSVTGEGSGIGLWLVDNIMKAHGGELLCAPTNAEGWTEFKLVFPSDQARTNTNENATG